MSPAVDLVLDRLRACGCDPKPDGTGHAFKCPAHEDKRPSAHLAEGADGRALLKCMAGCPHGAILERLGLTERDLFVPRNGASPRTRKRLTSPWPTSHGRPEVARYAYTIDDGAGEALKVRYQDDAGKEFQWYELEGDGFLSGLGGKKADLYLLPAVREGIKRGALIVLSEGEKAVERLAIHDGDDTRDFVGTCGPSGADSFKGPAGARLAQQLAGAAEVLVVVDRDEAGARWAEDARHHLESRVQSLRFVQSRVTAAKADLYDHLEAGHSLAELAPMAEAGAPDDGTNEVPRPTNLYGESFEPKKPEFDVKSFIRKSGLLIAWAAPGGLKTHTAMTLVHEMLCDTGTGRLFGHPELWIARRWKRVLWIATEECGDELRGQAEEILKGLGKDKLDGELHYLFAATAGARVTLDDLPLLIERDGPWDAIVLDSLTGLRPKVVNGVSVKWDGDNDASNEMCLKLRGLAAKHGVCFLILHHTGRDTTRYRGGVEWWASADTMFGLLPDNGRVKVDVEKVRGGKKPAPFTLEPEWCADGSFSLTYAGTSTVKLTDTQKTIHAWFLGRGQASQAQAIAAKLGTRSTVQRTISTLIAAGLLRDTGNAINGSPILAGVPTGAQDDAGTTELEK